MVGVQIDGFEEIEGAEVGAIVGAGLMGNVQPPASRYFSWKETVLSPTQPFPPRSS
jgi:hypothetical protein